MNDHRRLQRALLLYEQSNLTAAEDELRQFLLEDPQHPVAHAILGLCLSHREAYDEATQEARLAIQHGPDMGLTHYAMASVLEDRNRLPEGLEAVGVAIEIEPENASYVGLQAAILLRQRRWSDALEAADRGLSLDPHDPSCGNVRAAALVKLGRNEEANKTIDGMLEKAPTDSRAHANLGWSLLHQGEHLKALEHFRESLRLDPNSEWARAGTLEAIKARNVVYRLLLRFFLAMSKLSRGGQWGVILGLWIGYRIILKLGQEFPDWAPYLRPLLFVYIAFVALTWIGVPLFNLILRFDKFGRYVLSKDERRESNIFGVMLAMTIVFAVLAILYMGIWVWAALVTGLLLLPISATFRCQEGWPRNAMTAYTALVGAVGLASFVSPELVFIFAVGCILSSFVGNILASQSPKK